MKTRFKRAAIFFLLPVLFCAPLPAAWAEEWTAPVLSEEIAAADDYTDYIVLEEEVPVYEDLILEEAVTPIEEELLLEEAPAAKPQSSAAKPQSSAVGPGAAPQLQAASGGDSVVLDMHELDTGVYFYAEFNDSGSVNFRLLLPENARGGEYTLMTEDGQGGSAVVENAPGQRVIDVFSYVRPDQLFYDMALTLRHGEQERRITVRDYLASCGGAGMPVPAKTAYCAGAISGVSDWHAGLVFDGGDTSILLCFRAEDPSGLRFVCPYHEVTAVKRENAGLWSVRVKGVTAAELPADLVITVMKGEELALLSYSPLCYAAAHWYEDSSFILLCKALTAVLAQ